MTWRDDVIWDASYDGMGHCFVDVPFFGTTRVSVILDFDTNTPLNDHADAAYQRLTGLTGQQREAMRPLFFEQAQICCEMTSYGVPRLEGETETEANLRHFGITGQDIEIKSGWLKSASILGRRDGGFDCVLQFYPPWEEEHGAQITVEPDGRVTLGAY